MIIELNNVACSTGGDGCWSREKKKVILPNMELVVYDDNLFGELRVYFDTSTWNIESDGLIYTDRTFMNEFRSILENIGFSKQNVACVDYSEQGMQGDDYISLDAGENFVKAFKAISQSL